MKTFQQFHTSKIFEIPKQQRPYSWGEFQVEQFVRDLHTSIERGKHHYCGPIFLEATRIDDGTVKDDTEDENSTILKHRNILDGQQRVTTIMLTAVFLANHKHLSKAISDGTAGSSGLKENLQNIYSYITAGSSNFDSPKIVFNNSDMDKMFGYIAFSVPNTLPGYVTTGEERLHKNFVWLADNFDEICEIKDYNDLKKVINIFLNGMKLQLVEMGSQNFNKYTVFESINNRGLNLSEFDKIKNLFLHIAEQHEVRSVKNNSTAKITVKLVQEAWHKTVKSLFKYGMTKDETKCISDLWAVIYGIHDLKSDVIFKTVTDKFSKLVDSEDTALLSELITYVNSWETYTTGYCQLYTKEKLYMLNRSFMNSDGVENVERMLYQISLPSVFRMPLTAAFVKYSKSDFGVISTFLEKALMRIHGMKTKRNINSVDKPMTEWAQKVYHGLSIENAKKEICKIVVKNASLNDVVNNLLSGKDIYPSGWKGTSLYYFLYRIDNSLTASKVKFETVASKRKSEIEHIMPKAFRTNWSSMWPNPERGDNWLHRIGNLTLTKNNDSNKDLGIKTIKEKCTQTGLYNYTNGRLIEREIPKIAVRYADAKESHYWREIEIMENEVEYAKHFVKLWALPCDCDLESVLGLEHWNNAHKEQLIDLELFDEENYNKRTIVPNEIFETSEEIVSCEDNSSHEEE